MVEVPAGAAAVVGGSSSSSSMGVPIATQWVASLLAPGHTVVQQELLHQGSQQAQQQQQLQHQTPAKPPRNSRKGHQGARKGGAAATAASRRGAGSMAGGPAGHSVPGAGSQLLVLHLHVPELQDLWQQLQEAEQQVAAAAAAALSRVADTFLGAYGVFRSLVAAVADLDVLAGFAQVCVCLSACVCSLHV